MFCTVKLHLLYNLPPNHIVDRVCSAASCIINCICGKMDNSRIYYLFRRSRWIGAKTHYYGDYLKFKLISISSKFSHLGNIFLPKFCFLYASLRRPIGQVLSMNRRHLRVSHLARFQLELTSVPTTLHAATNERKLFFTIVTVVIYKSLSFPALRLHSIVYRLPITSEHKSHFPSKSIFCNL